MPPKGWLHQYGCLGRCCPGQPNPNLSPNGNRRAIHTFDNTETRSNSTRCHIPNAELKNVAEKNSRPMGFDDDQIENLERDHKKNQLNRVIPDVCDAYVQ